ncbi:MAG: hypothetical protein MJ181_05560 [Treponema sp.]|nr:hypothetical protein [Treponema sp.]
MLGKLIKHEFKNTYKVMLAVYAAYILLTLLGSLSSYNLSKGSAEPNFLTISVIIFYVLSCVAVYISTFVYICIRYYKTMYSTQGYLTHTLPVKGITIFNAKLIVSTIWMIVSVLVLMVSVFFFVNSASQGEVWKSFTTYSWSEFNRRFFEEVGMYFTPIIWTGIYGVIVGMVLVNLWIFASFALGQLSDKHKVAYSVLSGMGLYFLFQITGLAEIMTSIKRAEALDSLESAVSDFEVFFNSAITRSIETSIIVCLVLYGICVFINKKKLNLE